MNTIKIDTLGNEFLIEICHHENELPEIKKLDDSIFNAHQGISNELLLAIFKQGGLLVYKINNQIVGESQVLFESAAGQSIENKQTALFYGTAVLPAFRGHRIGEALALAQEKLAITKGKTRAILSVRPENATSISLRLKMGFKIISWEADYYGSGRLMMEKWLTPKPIETTKPTGKVIQSVTIKIGDEIDISARKQLTILFERDLKLTAYRLINSAKAILEFSE